MNSPVVHKNVSVIEVEELFLMDMLFANARTGACLSARLSDTLAVVTPGKFVVLLDELRKSGHTPGVREI